MLVQKPSLSVAGTSCSIPGQYKCDENGRIYACTLDNEWKSYGICTDYGFENSCKTTSPKSEIEYVCNSGSVNGFICSETDGGENSNEQGTNTGKYITGTGFKETDKCDDEYWLKEYVCGENELLILNINCNSENKACSDGKCVKDNLIYYILGGLLALGGGVVGYFKWLR